MSREVSSNAGQTQRGSTLIKLKYTPGTLTGFEDDRGFLHVAASGSQEVSARRFRL